VTKKAERVRIEQEAVRERDWRRWGPYLADRQWGTVREDYSGTGEVWTYLPHDHARSRAYRWGEDGLLGITDRSCRLCFSVALWNEADPILKERLFGLTGPEGNHGEDVKELYYFVDATPTFSYGKALYKYPQAAFPYTQLVEENRRRGADDPEFELLDTGVFADNRYFDVIVEYAKAAPNDLLIRVTCANRGPETAPLHLLPTVWQRNTWSWGRTIEGYWPRGLISRAGDHALRAEHPALQPFVFESGPVDGIEPRWLFTENETNAERLFGVDSVTPFVKDAFHRRVIHGQQAAVNPKGEGTKAASWYRFEIPGGEQVVFHGRLAAADLATSALSPAEIDAVFEQRIAEADEFHGAQRDAPLEDAERLVVRQADAGLIWSRKFYHFIVAHWLEGDPAQPPPLDSRRNGRNREWRHLWARDIMSLPDGWEYPWFAAWDSAFHCVAMARIDPVFAKTQMLLLAHEWYMHPNGQIPAYEFAFGDVNPPVHAWAVWRIYRLAAQAGWGRDRLFLEEAFQKCLVNFTWWVNRKDADGNNLFAGGFLGLDNIGVFDRSNPLPGVSNLEQADATAWMAFYASTLLAMSMELASVDDAYADIAWKFFEHFSSITHAMNQLGGSGLWHEQDGFYYDAVELDGRTIPMQVRSMVGLIPLFAAETLSEEQLSKLPLFRKRLQWYLDNRPEVSEKNACMAKTDGKRLLAIPSCERLQRVLRYVFDEREFLSPYGIRSLSRVHLEQPYTLRVDGHVAEVRYTPGESETGMFGGNSNWRGPIWFPLNYLLIEALKRYHYFYGDDLKVECPTGSGNWVDLRTAAGEIERRLTRLFTIGDDGRRPCHGQERAYADDPHFRDLVLFYEYFHGDTGRGVGAAHQTGWTALAGNLLERVAIERNR